MCRTKHPSSSVRRNLRGAVSARPKAVVRVPLEEDWVPQLIVAVAMERLQAVAEVQVISGVWH